MERQNVGPVLLAKSTGLARRASTRFPLTLDVRYTAAGRRGPETGSGRTIDMSSSGLAFTADRPLLTGQRLELSIDWPVRLNGIVQLQLMISGVVVRTSGTVTALEIRRHEFRTRRAAVKAASSVG